MLQRITFLLFTYFVLLIARISCDNNGYENDIQTPAVLENSADVIMKEDAEEIFYDWDVRKYEGEDIRCPPPVVPENGNLIGEDTRLGSIVYIYCLEGYWLEGPSIMACTMQGEVATWHPSPTKTCVKGHTFFKEGDSVEMSNDIPMPNDEIIGDGIPQSPPFVPHIWKRPVKALAQEKEDLAEHTGDERLRQEAEDKLPPFCLVKPDVGHCHGIFRRYYFDTETLECKRFYYGGCGGNRNNFESVIDCTTYCKGLSVLESGRK